MKIIKVAPINPAISFDILEKIDIRVGTIELVENVQGSDKLVRLYGESIFSTPDKVQGQVRT